ncbi:hypothetical protein [Tautonia plasticadhaerens]|uniref:Uncharacterized protein n=1 Tax=Tautonia plasticadhaerens TaxID=2527974 RepID=A0A518H684_9BACT|nr:hypothetical protein [Tautonia plasticadhaerens]QDV36354.1 hypothetical protein ElP_42740 [Tautonia plasticadhaerens]QDV39237.1 hypothetical protein ElP_72010 [Tautonia plasticadhaerens]
MCLGIAVTESNLPTELIGRFGMAHRRYTRGGQAEYRFLFRDRRPCLPIWRDGRLQVARWGNSRGQSRRLPRTGWTWQQTVKDGGWRDSGAIPVEIPASYGLERRGVWYLIETGIRGLLVPDERGWAVAYMLCEPASHYYRIMTGAERMPVLIDQRI